MPRLLVSFYLYSPEFPWGRGWGRMEERGSPYMGNRLVLWPLGCIPMVVHIRDQAIILFSVFFRLNNDDIYCLLPSLGFAIMYPEFLLLHTQFIYIKYMYNNPRHCNWLLFCQTICTYNCYNILKTKSHSYFIKSVHCYIKI
jgi:hypothetical protein